MSIQSESFKDVMNKGYTFDCPAIQLGVGIFEGQVHRDVQVSIPIKTLNRHGLIAGSTGSGKTKTLQILAEQLSQNGIPSLIMDLKGDLSGIGAKADINSKITERMEMVGLPYTPNKSPVEFLTISQEYGTKLRSTVIEFHFCYPKFLTLTKHNREFSHLYFNGLMIIKFHYLTSRI
jgi:Cdc6-like AAA superfamily ATPase